MLSYSCRDCAKSYDISTYAWRCECGGLFDLRKSDVGRGIFRDANDWSLWRYDFLSPYTSSASLGAAITLGEGMTPIIKESVGSVLKLDYLMPTLSFKDRGSTVLVSHAKAINVHRAAADSSGNAGVSLAAYCAVAGIELDIFLPEGTTKRKIKQLDAFGAKVHVIQGDRSAASEAAIDHVESHKIFYASHIYNPLFFHGTKTYLYELFEQLGGRLCENIFIPLGNGTLLLGVSLGLRELRSLGLIDSSPRIIAVQASECSPIAKKWREESLTESSSYLCGESAGSSIASGIAITNPPRIDQIVTAVIESGGSFVTVDNSEIQEARAALGRRGIDVEPTGAVAYAGSIKYFSVTPIEGGAAIALTGAGLKSD